MSEDERRELIARQHRALYGNESNLYSPDSPEAAAAASQRRQSQDVRVGSLNGPAGTRGASPLAAFGPFGGVQAQSGGGGAEPVVQMPSRDLPKSPNSVTSPSSNPASQFGLIDQSTQHSSRTSVSSPSPPLTQGAKSTAAGVVPIGTRPVQPAAVSSIKGRSTTPLPSPLSYGFNAGEGNAMAKTERSASAASSVAADKPISGLGASWASNSSGWGASKNPLGVQASVWG